MVKCKQVATHKHAYAYKLNFPFVSFRSKETSHAHAHKVKEKRQKIITTKRHMLIAFAHYLQTDLFQSD